MANTWGNNGNSDSLSFLGLQNHCRWWMQPWNQKTLTFWKKSYDKPRQHIKKQRYYSANKSPSSQKLMVFPAVMYGCESWIIKKPERQRFDDFELWCWRRLLRIPWTARRSNQLVLTEISTEYSLEGLMLKLKLQCFGHLMRSTDSLEKTLMMGKIEGWMRGDKRGWDGWMASLIQSHEFEQASLVMDREAWHFAVYGVAKSQMWLSDWTEPQIKLLLERKSSIVSGKILNDISVLIKVRLLGKPNERTWSNEQLRRQELVKKTKSLQELNCKESDKDWITSPLPNSYVEVLIPNVAVLGDRTF